MNYINKSSPLAAAGVGVRRQEPAGGGWSPPATSLGGRQLAGQVARLFLGSHLDCPGRSLNPLSFSSGLFSAEDLMRISISNNIIYRW